MSISLSQVIADYYMLGDAAQKLGVNKVTIWRWIKAGKLQSHRIGREVLIEKAEVDRLQK